MSRQSAMEKYKYWAFISYSHRDQSSADWLLTRLESFSIPRRLRRQLPNNVPRPDRCAPIFLDRAELPAGCGLGPTIAKALLESRFLIVIASPVAAKSEHVAAEIEYFIRQQGSQRVLTFIVAGRPNAVPRGYGADEECLPEALRQVGGSSDTLLDRQIALGADARGGRAARAHAFRRITAGLLNVSYGTLQRRDLHRKMLQAASIMLATLGVVVVILVPSGHLSRLALRAQILIAQVLPENLRGDPRQWIGTWQGNIASTCGQYSGPLTYVIAEGGRNRLLLTYNGGGMTSGSYTLTYSDAKAISEDIPGAAYFRIADNAMTVVYARSCQTGKLTKQ
jgi:hypothetical protein